MKTSNIEAQNYGNEIFLEKVRNGDNSFEWIVGNYLEKQGYTEGQIDQEKYKYINDSFKAELANSLGLAIHPDDKTIYQEKYQSYDQMKANALSVYIYHQEHKYSLGQVQQKVTEVIMLMD